MQYCFMTRIFVILFFFMYARRVPPVIISVIKMTSYLSLFCQPFIKCRMFLCCKFFIKFISDLIRFRSSSGRRIRLITFQAISLPVSLSSPLYTILYAPLPSSSLNLTNRPFGDTSATSLST
jgi:hypothetical protein